MRSLLILFLLGIGPASAGAPPARLGYIAYVAGVPVFTLRADVALDAQSYRLTLGYRTLGLVDAFFHSDLNSASEGTFAELVPQPRRFTAWGIFRDTARQSLIDYVAGRPVIRTLVPPAEKEREPVPPERTADTVDTLSALAMLVHRVNETGRCEGSVRVYDGRRLSEIAAKTRGTETLAPERDSRFAGPALRCDFSGRMLAGFLYDDDRARAAEPQEGTAWIAPPAPGLPRLPVRIAFRVRLFGAATAYLTSAEPMDRPPAAP